MMADTAEQLRSHLASRKWRLENLHTILAGGTEEHPEIGLRPFTPNPAQIDYDRNSHTLDAILKARKMGFSTFKAVDICDEATLVSNMTFGIIDYTLPDAKKKLQMVRTSWENMDNGRLHPKTWRLGKELKKRNPIIGDAKESLEWHNGSTLAVSTSFRGSTPNYLWLSEFGKIAAFRSGQATEIVNGAFNSILPGQRITSESTHEAGKFGEHYKLLSRAMKAQSLPRLTSMDWKFHFFPWWRHPAYRMEPDGRPIRPEIERYFQQLAARHGIVCTEAQMFWYDLKQQEQGYGMKKEFPSTPGEAFEALVTGAIWGREITDLRAAGRVKPLEVGPEPIYTFWDLGYSDFTAIWLIQPAGRDVLVHNFYQNHRLHTGRYMEVIKKWERHYDRTISQHFLPHDAESHGGGGISPIELLLEAGMPRREITIVPRSPDPWVGINHARTLLGRAYFNEGTTDCIIERDGVEFPSGLACLENYKTRVNQQGDYETNIIVHDEFSHPADGFRTFAEADKLGLIKHAASGTTLQIVNTVPSAWSPTHSNRRRR